MDSIMIIDIYMIVSKGFHKIWLIICWRIVKFVKTLIKTNSNNIELIYLVYRQKVKKQKLDSKTQIQTKPTTDSDFLPWIKVFYIFVWLQLVYHSELFVEKIRHNKNGKYLTIIDSLNFSQFDQCIQIIIRHNCSTLDVIHNLSQFAIESK